MLTGHEADILVFHSTLRWTPDPMVGETIIVGLLAFTEDGTWARFRARPIKTRATGIATPAQVAVAEEWIHSFQVGALADGPTGLLGHGITVEDVNRWAVRGESSMRFSEPSAALGRSLDDAWATLVTRYLGPTRGAASTLSARLTGVHERQLVLRRFTAQCRRAPVLRHAVHRSQRVQGHRLAHSIDLTIETGRLAAVAQALPFAHGSPREMGERRALLFEAALDLPSDVIKLGLYEDVPAGRVALLDQTRQFIEAHFDASVSLVGRANFETVVAKLSEAVTQGTGAVRLGL
jgi:hypothetical protein